MTSQLTQFICTMLGHQWAWWDDDGVRVRCLRCHAIGCDADVMDDDHQRVA